MTITATITVSPAAPKSADTVTATYTVTGNDPVAPTSTQVSGVAHVGDQDIDVTTTITLPGVPSLPETFTAPTCDGLTFEATDQPNVFTALVP